MTCRFCGCNPRRQAPSGTPSQWILGCGHIRGGKSVILPSNNILGLTPILVVSRPCRSSLGNCLPWTDPNLPRAKPRRRPKVLQVVVSRPGTEAAQISSNDRIAAKIGKKGNKGSAFNAAVTKLQSSRKPQDEEAATMLLDF